MKDFQFCTLISTIFLTSGVIANYDPTLIVLAVVWAALAVVAFIWRGI